MVTSPMKKWSPLNIAVLQAGGYALGSRRLKCCVRLIKLRSLMVVSHLARKRATNG